MKLSFLTPNSALRIILKLLIPHCALLIILSSCINAKFNHPMDGIILNAVLLNTTRNASLAQTVVFTGLPSVITEGQTASVDVKLALATTSAIQVTLTLDNPAITVDGLASKVLTFAPDNATVNQTIKLAAVADSNNISELVNMKVIATGLADQTVSISAVDTTGAIPTITVTNTPTSVKEGGTATFGVKLTGTITSSTIITVASSISTSASVSPASLTFTSTNSTTDQIVTISGLQDINITSESLTITLSSSGLADVTLNITITDDDCYAWGCFADNENGTVSFTGAGTLAGTNLVWMKCSQGQTYDASSKTCTGTAGTFQYCLSNTNACDNGTILNGTGTSAVYNTCNLLNTNPIGGYAGRTAWRVPTKDELKSLIYCSNGPDTPLLTDSTPCQSGSILPAIHSSFSANASYYRSSTSSATNTAWNVSFGGITNSNSDFKAAFSYPVRCVSLP